MKQTTSGATRVETGRGSTATGDLGGSPVNGVLLLYRLSTWQSNATTISEHVDAFERYSGFRVWPVNTAWGFPKGIMNLTFRVIVFHHSLNLEIDGTPLSEYLDASTKSYKIAFFQDEHHLARRRFGFLDRYQVDCVYTLLEEPQFERVYGDLTNVSKMVNVLPGYVSEGLVEAAQKFSIPDERRRFDVRYRGRSLPFYMGKGGQEKHEIALRFEEHAKDLGLNLDLETDEGERIYGDGWYRFLADSRAVLGVEAGVSIFDTTDEVRIEHDRILADSPQTGFAEMSELLLAPWEDRIYYRTISPRHFEAAAFRVCQILYEGKYSGIMQPNVHYIALKKDFSNFDEVVRMFKDDTTRREIAENAYRDLIASEEYSYSQFVRSFDEELEAEGFTPEITREEERSVTRALRAGSLVRLMKRIPYILMVYPYPGRETGFPGRKRAERLFRAVLSRQKA